MRWVVEVRWIEGRVGVALISSLPLPLHPFLLPYGGSYSVPFVLTKAKERIPIIQWNLLIRTPLGAAILSFTDRLSSFRRDSLQSVYTRVLSACPLLGGLSSFGVSFIRYFTVDRKKVRGESLKGKEMKAQG